MPAYFFDKKGENDRGHLTKTSFAFIK